MNNKKYLHINKLANNLKHHFSYLFDLNDEDYDAMEQDRSIFLDYLAVALTIHFKSKGWTFEAWQIDHIIDKDLNKF